MIYIKEREVSNICLSWTAITAPILVLHENRDSIIQETNNVSYIYSSIKLSLEVFPSALTLAN